MTFAAVIGLVAMGCVVTETSVNRRPGMGGSDDDDSSPTTSIPKGGGFTCDVAKLLETKCQACHGDTPTSGAKGRLVTMKDLLGPSKTDPSRNAATIALERMKDTARPMPPASYSDPVTDSEVEAFEAWIAGGYKGACGDASPTTTTTTAGRDDAGSSSASTPSGLGCTSCHGDPARAAVTGADPMLNAAPPRNTKGETGPTARAVGAHQAHLTKGSLSKLVACNDCHVVPGSTSHANGVVGLTFGTLAKTGNKTPVFNAGACSATYCHGNFAGGKNAIPSWTDGAMTCTSCHDAPPATGDHRRGDHDGPCSDCHGTGFTSTTVDKALHLNGVKNVGGTGSKINTYDPATRSCSPKCHGRETW